ncbi:MAG: carboxypeptidase regulatory-like domain-containing protein [Thiovulaceae bacterium]|nr:carboxypeptidase regulatory-like domain-containing protein [Sulfurimonadaceae bacterium]
MYLSPKKSFLTLLTATAFLTGCQGSNSQTTDSTIAKGVVRDSASGLGIANVQVSVDGSTTTTDDQGFYTLENVPADNKAVVTFDSEGYYRNSAVIQIDKYLEGTTTLSPNYLEFSLGKYTDTNTGDSQNEMAFSVQDGFGLYIPGGIYTDAAGNAYSGKVTANGTYRKQTQSSQDVEFPGDYSGKSSNGIIVPFVSYGFVVIDLTDANGTALGISDNITLTFPATGATDSLIPLWYYDYDQGLWLEEGYAEVQADGTYMGAISHTGTWSLSKPVENAIGIYRGRIIHENGTPASDVRVNAVGENWTATDLSTDADGNFEIEVIPGSDFQLTAYNYKDEYKAVYNVIIQAIASGDLVEE